MKIASDFGTISPPDALSRFGSGLGGLPVFLSVVLRTMIMGAGLYTLINIILAGYAYLSAGGDSKKIADATAKITQSLIGLLVAAGSFVIAAIVGLLLFGDAGGLLNVKVYGP